MFILSPTDTGQALPGHALRRTTTAMALTNDRTTAHGKASPDRQTPNRSVVSGLYAGWSHAAKVLSLSAVFDLRPVHDYARSFTGRAHRRSVDRTYGRCEAPQSQQDELTRVLGSVTKRAKRRVKRPNKSW
jgi:hypothetical protein